MLAEGTTSGGKVLEPVHGAVRRGAPSTRHSLVRELRYGSSSGADTAPFQGLLVLMYMLRFLFRNSVPQEIPGNPKPG